MIQVANLGSVNQALSLPLAFIGGLLASFSPCIFTIVPLFLNQASRRNSRRRLQGLLFAVVFVTGMSVVFVWMGLMTAWIGIWLLAYRRYFFLVIGTVLIVSALGVFGMFQKNQNFCAIAPDPPPAQGLLGVFGSGLLAGLIASPCSTPILAAILAMASSSGSLRQASALLFSYSLGHGVILLLVGISLSDVQKWLRKPAFSRFASQLRTLFGVGVLAGGFYLFYLGI